MPTSTARATQPSPSRTLEDTCVRFLGAHAGKIYAGLAVLAVCVVAMRHGSA